MLNSSITAQHEEYDAFDETHSRPASTYKQSGNVISWPKNTKRNAEKAAAMQKEESELQQGMELLRKLSQPSASEREAATEQMFLGAVPAPPVEVSRGPLQEEMPKAVEAYRKAWVYVRKALPEIVAAGKIDIPGVEMAVGGLLSSLERNRDALFCLTKLVSPKNYVYTHSVNVCIYLGAYALASGQSRSEALVAGTAGMLHDLGMAMLPLSLLRANGGLSPTEKVLVRRHPLLAHEMLCKTPGVCSDILGAVLEHHERFDGSGYPLGMSGKDISFMGHLSSIASAFDAMSSDRQFKRSLQPHYALREMFKLRGTQFHPDILDSFIKMIGIFPVGTAVRLEDGYLGVVSAVSANNLTRPVVTLVRDPNGRPMMHLECDMSKENVAGIACCLEPDEVGIPVHQILGIR